MGDGNHGTEVHEGQRLMTSLRMNIHLLNTRKESHLMACHAEDQIRYIPTSQTLTAGMCVKGRERMTVKLHVIVNGALKGWVEEHYWVFLPVNYRAITGLQANTFLPFQ